MPITISAAQREVLYVQVLDHLSGLGDLWLAIEGEDYPRADALGHAFADDLRLLLEDLGWPDREELPSGGRVELTMPPDDLRRVIERSDRALRQHDPRLALRLQRCFGGTGLRAAG
ncbi:MAG TPA: hypothetical protein VHI77_03585 [Solirubrobacterales bacterium]|jgi:hypothetical protein|nr:hypothetical protein [Solirubrobacterales bacterium]